MKFLRKFRSAEEYAEYIRTADSSNMHLAPTISLLAFGDEEKPKVGYVNADLTFKFTTEMEYEERWFSTRGGGGSGPGYSISTFESVSGQTSGGFVKQAYLDGKLYYVNNGNIYDGGISPDSLRYNASTSSQASWWDGIIVKEPGQHILQLVLDKTGVEDEFIVENTGFMNIDELYIDDTITALGEYFIDGNVGTLYVPETVSYIHSNALGNDTLSIQIHENNPYIESISNDNGLVHKDSGTLFYVNKNVTEFTIPEGIKGIADSVFYYASDLVSITFPSTLEWIGEFVFYECRGLTGELVIPDSVISIGNHAFYQCSGLTSVEIGSGCTSIGGAAFMYCSNLTSLEIGNGVTSIGISAFNGCLGLTSVMIPDSVTSIGQNAFNQCSGLTSIVIPDSVTSIGDYAFQNCSNLTSLEIGSGVTSIGNQAFSGCTSLTGELVIPDSVTSIGNNAFSYCSGLTGELIIPDSVTSLGQSAFEYCKGLTSVEIGSGVTSIGNYVFRYCSGLTGELVIPDSMTTIGSQTFQGCSGLTSVEIGSGVTSIGKYVFRYCSGLTEITCHAVTAPSITRYTFQNVNSNGTLYVPFGSDYSSWMSTGSYYLGYYKWTQQVTYSPTECTSLSITADDVNGRATNTTIYWTAVTNGADSAGNPINNITFTGETISSEFPQNTSETETVERTITFEYMGVTASTTITQGVWVNAGYTVDLNSQWQLSTSITNPSSATYDGVYESFSNKGKDNTAAIMYIDIVGYENFKFYVRSNAESSYDFVVVSNLDCTLTNETTSGSNVKMTTSGNQNSGTAISNYTLVEFTGIDGNEHRISVMYRKDSSQASGTDQGYVLIPKNQ